MALTSLFCEFKENCNKDNAITDYTRKENELSIHINCLEKDIDIKKKEIVRYICIINMDFPAICAMGSCSKKKRMFLQKQFIFRRGFSVFEKEKLILFFVVLIFFC